MTVSIVDDVTAIRARLREIRSDEGRCEDDWRTANDRDLEGIAARYGLARMPAEGDYALRQRIAAAIGDVS